MGCLCNPNFMPVHFKLDKHEIRNALACIFRLPQTIDNKPFTNFLIFVRKPEDFLSVFLFIFLPKIHSSSLPPSLFSPFICHLLPCMPLPFLPYMPSFRFPFSASPLPPVLSLSFRPPFLKSRNPSSTKARTQVLKKTGIPKPELPFISRHQPLTPWKCYLNKFILSLLNHLLGAIEAFHHKPFKTHKKRR